MLVKILRSSGSSIVVEGEAGVLYSTGRWSKAPNWLAEKGYHPTYFTCLRHALACAEENGWQGEAWEVRIRGKQPVPKLLISFYLNKGGVFLAQAEWPEGTGMAKRIKLVRQLGKVDGSSFYERI